MKISTISNPAPAHPEPGGRPDLPASFPAAQPQAAPPQRAQTDFPKDGSLKADKRKGERDVEAAVEILNTHLAERRIEARYSVSEKSRNVVIKIVNADSGEVLRQIPNETAIRLAEALTARKPSPHLVDEKA